MTLHKSKGDEFDYVFIPELIQDNLCLNINELKNVIKDKYKLFGLKLNSLNIFIFIIKLSYSCDALSNISGCSHNKFVDNMPDSTSSKRLLNVFMFVTCNVVLITF